MLNNQTAVVTGAARGIGRQIAFKLADNGANIIVADIKTEAPEGKEPTDALIDADETRGEFVETDITDSSDVTHLFNYVDDEFDGLDLLVNNAGVHSVDAPVLELDREDDLVIFEGKREAETAIRLDLIENGDVVFTTNPCPVQVVA